MSSKHPQKQPKKQVPFRFTKSLIGSAWVLDNGISLTDDLVNRVDDIFQGVMRKETRVGM